MEYTVQTVSAILFSIVTVLVILFQLGLALGMPWGAASMGGKYPGKYPPRMRLVAMGSMLTLILLIVVVLSKADVAFFQLSSISRIGIWFVVVFSCIGTTLNLITPSKIERIWAPVAGIQLLTSLIVALA